MTDTDAVFREEAKPKPKPTDETKPGDTGGTSTTSARPGDVPHHTDQAGGGAFESSEDAFRAAAGLESSGTTGNKSFTISQFDSNVGQGEGISRGQVVKYTGEDGTIIQGGQYHNKEGTFFKTPEGDTYKVQMDSTNNSYSLQPTKPGQQPIEATQRDVVSNSFGQFNNPFRQNSNGENPGNGGQAGDLGSNGRRSDGTTGSGTLPNATGDSTTALPANGTKPAVAPEKAAVAPVVAPAATLQTDHTVVAPVVAPVAAALQPADRSALPAAQPVADRSVAPAQTTPAAKLSDPAQFYTAFKGASDADRRDMVASLAAMPRSDRSDFIHQVAAAAKTTDLSNAPDILRDINKTVYAVARGESSSEAPSQSGPPKINDASTVTSQPPASTKISDAGVAAGGQTSATPKVDVASLQPTVKVPDANVGNSTLQTNLGALPSLKNSGTTDGGLVSSVARALPTPDAGNGGQRISLNPDAAKVVTSVEGTVLRSGQQIDVAKLAQIPSGDPKADLSRGVLGQQPGGIPGGDSFKPDPRNIPGQGQPIDASILAGRGLDGKITPPGLTPGVINPGDKIQIGAQAQLPDILARGHGQPGDGNAGNNPLGQVIARGRDGGDLPQSGVLPQQRNLIPGLDVNDPQTKAFLTDALRQLQATKVGDFDPRNQNQSLQDILKGFDPHKVERLQAFLNPDGKGPITDAAVGRLAVALSPGSERLTGSAATDLTLGQRTAIDRLTDLVRNNQNLIDLTTMQTRDSRMLLEINKMVGDVNRQFGFEGKNVLGLGDIIGRSLDGTKGGERGAGLEGRGPLDRPISQDPLSFTARLTPAQELAIRAFLENRDFRAATLDHANANANPIFASRQIELTGKQDPHAKVELGVKPELPGKIDPKTDLVGKQELAGKPDLNVRHDLTAKSDLTGRLDPKTDLTPIRPELTGKPDLTGKELGAKGDLTGKTEPAGKQEIGRSDQIIRPPDLKDKDERTDRVDGHLPFGKLDNTVTNLDGTPKNKAQIDKELAEKQKQERERQEEAQRRDAALMTLMADRKLREEKEKQQKEEETLREKKQDEDARRRRYVVRERDTLESIASKQLKDGKLAGLIHEINIKELATKRENGRELPDLRPRQVIWLPSGVDVREYRKRSGSSSMSSSDTKLSAQEELALRFGKNWDGAALSTDTESGATGDTDGGVNSDAEHGAELSPAAVAAAQKRRANIESLLGPLTKHIPADGRIRYVVRLGDTLKSVAMKHPSLQDISLWQLLAVINDIPTDTDDRGIPQAKLSRGSTLMLPSEEEIESFRQKHGVKTTPLERNTKSCPQCGRMSAAGAAICGACAHSFNLEKARPKPSDAGMVVMEAAGFVAKPGVPLAKRPAPPPETLEEEPAPALPAPLYQPGAQLAIVPLDEQTRLARCINHGETPTTVVVVEVSREDSWQPVVAYEIFAHNSMRHEYTPRGDRKSVRIDLPIDAILELSNNDLKGNWKNYRDRYFAQLISLNR